MTARRSATTSVPVLSWATIADMARPRPAHRPVSLSYSHWREDGLAKVRYPSRAEALSAAEERARESGVELGAYRCDYCNGWHMGRRSARQER